MVSKDHYLLCKKRKSVIMVEQRLKFPSQLILINKGYYSAWASTWHGLHSFGPSRVSSPRTICRPEHFASQYEFVVHTICWLTNLSICNKTCWPTFLLANINLSANNKKRCRNNLLTWQFHNKIHIMSSVKMSLPC